LLFFCFFVECENQQLGLQPALFIASTERKKISHRKRAAAS